MKSVNKQEFVEYMTEMLEHVVDSGESLEVPQLASKKVDGSIYLFHTEAIHPTGEKFRSFEKLTLSNGMVLYLNIHFGNTQKAQVLNYFATWYDISLSGPDAVVDEREVVTVGMLHKTFQERKVMQYFNMYKRGEIKVDSTLQRKSGIWSSKQKALLIDTIRRNGVIPTIFLEVRKDNKMNDVYYIIDGQQRTDTIVDFIDGKFVVSQKQAPETKKFATDMCDEKFGDLDRSVKLGISDFKLQLCLVSNAKREDIVGMFQNLNTGGVRVNNQELRHVLFPNDVKGNYAYMVQKYANESYIDFLLKNRFITVGKVNRRLHEELVALWLSFIMRDVYDRSTELDKCYGEYYDCVIPQQYIDTFENCMKVLTKLDFSECKNFTTRSTFEGFFLAIKELLALGYTINTESIAHMQDFVEWFSIQMVVLKETLSDNLDEELNPTLNRFYSYTKSVYDSKISRANKRDIFKEYLMPFTIELDKSRFFNVQQRQAIWHMSKDKRCMFCGETVKSFEEYDADHVIPHSKGGRTVIDNGQVTHGINSDERCNQKHGNITVTLRE